MAKYTHDDIVRIRPDAVPGRGSEERAWVVAVIEDRKRFPLSKFPPGVIYSVEFEDGTAVDVHENDLEYF